VVPGNAEADEIDPAEGVHILLALANKIRYSAASINPPRRPEGPFFDNTQLMKQADAGSLFGVFIKE
jgi:hypothetical protein